MAWWARRLGAAAALVAVTLLPAAAEPGIRYLGLDGARARFLADGRTFTLAPGERGPNGHELLAAGAVSAWLRRDGRTFEIHANGAARRLAREVSLRAGADGRFVGDARVDGRPVEVEVDPGAAVVLLTAARARELGVRFSRRDSLRVTHAGRESLGYRAVLGEVRLGAVVVSGLPAVVVNGHEPRRPLLGAPFVARLESAVHDGNHLILRARADDRIRR